MFNSARPTTTRVTVWNTYDDWCDNAVKNLLSSTRLFRDADECWVSWVHKYRLFMFGWARLSSNWHIWCSVPWGLQTYRMWPDAAQLSDRQSQCELVKHALNYRTGRKGSTYGAKDALEVSFAQPRLSLRSVLFCVYSQHTHIIYMYYFVIFCWHQEWLTERPLQADLLGRRIAVATR